jgi:drug/metabolite transporter (DMT)-like permease
VDIALSFAAAFFFALGLVLMEKAASAQPATSVKVGFLTRLLRNRIWLAGLAAQGIGFVLQALALNYGRMVVVQTLLVATIVFALPIARFLTKRHIRRIEWWGAAIVAGGLAMLLAVTKTAEGTEDTSFGRWLVVGGVCIGIAVALLVLARGRGPALRAGLLGTASGILFGLAAALTKATVSRFNDGIWHVVADWHLYALIIVSVAAFWLEQASLQTGALSAAVASTMAFDPLSSIPLGIILFNETLHEGALGITVSVIGICILMVGLVLLARGKGADAHEPGLAPVPAPA